MHQSLRSARSSHCIETKLDDGSEWSSSAMPAFSGSCPSQSLLEGSQPITASWRNSAPISKHNDVVHQSVFQRDRVNLFVHEYQVM